MESVVNAWGGEGVLTATAVFLMGALGMFRGTVSAGERIHVRILDLERPEDAPEMTDYKRACDFAKLYEECYRKLYGGEPELVYDDISIYDVADLKNGTSVSMKYGVNPLLSLGCTRDDIDLEISKGIYGKPWLGEVFYCGRDDTSFDKLYKDIDNYELVAINCGGYRGGGTAATFVPMENAYNPENHKLTRYMVVSGPSTRFKLRLKLRSPEMARMYAGIPGLENLANGYDIFDIPEIREKMLTYSPDFEHFNLHQDNLRMLDDQWQAVVDDEKNLENLDPAYYAPRFLDRLYTDISQVSATFVNLKTDGKNLLDYDVTSDTYQPKIQTHKMHISSFINGLSVRELIANHKNYTDGGVYAFGYDGRGDTFSPDTLFNEAVAGAYSAFIITTIILTHYVNGVLSNKLIPFGQTKQKKSFFLFSGGAKEMTTDETNACQAALASVKSFYSKYLIKCLYMLEEIDSVSDMTKLLVSQIPTMGEQSAQGAGDAGLLDSTVNEILNFMKAQSSIPSNINNMDFVKSCLQGMKESLPSISGYVGKGELYGDKLVRLSMKTAQSIMHIQ